MSGPPWPPLEWSDYGREVVAQAERARNEFLLDLDLLSPAQMDELRPLERAWIKASPGYDTPVRSREYEPYAVAHAKFVLGYFALLASHGIKPRRLPPVTKSEPPARHQLTLQRFIRALITRPGNAGGYTLDDFEQACARLRAEGAR